MFSPTFLNSRVSLFWLWPLTQALAHPSASDAKSSSHFLKKSIGYSLKVLNDIDIYKIYWLKIFESAVKSF